MGNFFKTLFLLIALTLLLLAFGQAIGGERGMAVAFVLACVMNFTAYWMSDQIVLSLYRAEPVSEEDAPEIYEIVRELAAEAGMPVPRIYRIPSAAPNAFATGRNPEHAAVALTQGIVETLNREELKGVLAHELSHVFHRDILIASVAATLAGAIGMLASMVRWMFFLGGTRGSRQDNNPLVLLVMSILAPFAALLIQLAVSRSREYAADHRGAVWCGNPLYLASALRKLEAGSRRFPMRHPHETSAHLFIVNPLSGGGFSKLFSTHPPLEDRIARLEALAREKGL